MLRCHRAGVATIVPSREGTDSFFPQYGNSWSGVDQGRGGDSSILT
jgi:hypothetical protein